MDKNNKRVVLVTGATGGLGTAMCKKLFADGFHVIGNYRDEKKAKAWHEELKSHGIDVDIYYADVTNFDSVGEMVQKIENEIGKIDTLVNNAGITRDNLLLRMTEEAFDLVIDINLKSVFNYTKAAIKRVETSNQGVGDQD